MYCCSTLRTSPRMTRKSSLYSPAVEELGSKRHSDVFTEFSFITIGKDQGLDIRRLVQFVMRKWLARKETMGKFAVQGLVAVSHYFPFGNFENWIACS